MLRILFSPQSAYDQTPLGDIFEAQTHQARLKDEIDRLCII